MKKVVFAIAAAAVMMSCGGNKTENKVETPAAPAVEQSVKDEHNAKNSLDYQGTYKGTLPTASGEGMEVTVVLTADAFKKTTSYVGKKAAPEVVEGKYAWDEAGTIITLEGVDAPNKYFVAENVLFHLDADGKKIEGALADQYKLAKEVKEEAKEVKATK